MLGIACIGVVFPLIFSLLDKRGNSNCEERITLLERFIKLFGKECFDFISADREFVGEKRWQIETCFRAMKSSGFDIENTHLKDLQRIQKLLCLVMIAFVWCYLVGDYLDKNVKAIIIRKHGPLLFQ